MRLAFCEFKFLIPIVLGASLFGVASAPWAMGDDNTSKADSTTGTPYNPEAENRLLSDIKYLSSDELQGRAAETPGLKLGAEFIAERFRSLGLTTELIEGKPFQDFELEGSPIIGGAESNFLKIVKPNGETTSLGLDKAFQPLKLGSNAAFDAPMVFAGYGITPGDEEIKYDDFANLDVKGKVVVVIRKEPQVNDPKSPFDGTSPSQYALFTSKEINAAKHGAAALIVINDAASESTAPGALIGITGAGNALTKDQVPTLFLSRKVAEDWFNEVGKPLAEIEAKIDESLEPQSFEFEGWRAIGSTEVVIEKLPSMNVLGLLPGVGDLADEFVVIGAHFDHVGLGGSGSLAPGTIEVHNGADDNASGTVAVLETARALTQWAQESPDTPRRSILFITFSGEERGLLGSAYYVKHPRYELEKTVAMLNLDMVGRLADNELTIYGTGTANEFDELISDANQKLAFNITRSPEGLGPSDHQSFFQKGIPVMHFFTGLHNDYHRPSDDFDKINLSGISRVTDMVTTLANRIATTEQRPTFVKVQGRANPQANGRSSQRRIRLGIRLKLSESKVIVQEIVKGELADKAGIQAGDEILSVGEKPITSRAELDRILQEFKPGDSFAISVQRGEEKIELKVEL